MKSAKHLNTISLVEQSKGCNIWLWVCRLHLRTFLHLLLLRHRIYLVKALGRVHPVKWRWDEWSIWNFILVCFIPELYLFVRFPSLPWFGNQIQKDNNKLLQETPRYDITISSLQWDLTRRILLANNSRSGGELTLEQADESLISIEETFLSRVETLVSGDVGSSQHTRRSSREAGLTSRVSRLARDALSPSRMITLKMDEYTCKLCISVSRDTLC